MSITSITLTLGLVSKNLMPSEVSKEGAFLMMLGNYLIDLIIYVIRWYVRQAVLSFGSCNRRFFIYRHVTMALRVRIVWIWRLSSVCKPGTLHPCCPSLQYTSASTQLNKLKITTTPMVTICDNRRLNPLQTYVTLSVKRHSINIPILLIKRSG